MADKNPVEHFRDFAESLIPDLDLSDRFCTRPFEHVEIMHGYGADQSLNFGDTFSCCAGWLSKKIGSYATHSLPEIWNSEASQQIRASIIDGSFEFCNKKACPYIQDSRLPLRRSLSAKYQKIIRQKQVLMPELPQSYFLCYDRSCNLACPSCRKETIFFGKKEGGLGFSNPMKLNEKLLQDLFSKPTDRKINLKITGSGDPFASAVFMNLLSSLDGKNFPGLEVELYTNGLLFTPGNWDKLQSIHGNIKVVSVSIDAASAETYQKVRGGSWLQLLKNMDFMCQLKKEGQIQEFATNFVVQLANFRETADFVRLCLEKQVNLINFSFIADWDTWESKEKFQQQCIWRKDHPLFPELLLTLRDPIFSNPIVKLGSLLEYRKKALAESAWHQESTL